MFKQLSTLLAALTVGMCCYAQETFPRNGAYDERPGRYAFTNATIVVDSKTTIPNGSMLIENGVIKEVSKQIKIQAGTVVVDLKGKFIYPSLIDLDSDYGMPEVTRNRQGGGRQTPQLESNKKGAFGWNQAIQPENDASQVFTPDAKKATDLRKIGFGTVLVHTHDGIVRGSGALVTLIDESANKALLNKKASAHFSFSKGTSSQTYPSSTMGVVALLRQNYYDADWYSKEKSKDVNLSLDAFNQIKTLPAFFETNDKYSILRADKIGDEFGIQYIIRGGGDEYQRIKEVKATKATLILPLVFPDAYDVTDPWDADVVSMAQLKHWELAPKNASEVAKAEIPFAFTTAGMKNKADFWKNIKIAIEYGLPKEKALEALTTLPASLIKAENQIGSLKAGLLANFIITSGELFGKDNVIYENWVQGKKFIISPLNAPDIRGTYSLSLGSQPTGKLQITGSSEKPDYKILIQDTIKITPKVTLSNELLTISYQPDRKSPGTIRLTGWITGNGLAGEGVLPDGAVVSWTAPLTENYQQPAAAKDSTLARPKETGPIVYPFVGFGNEELPKAETVLIKNATVWTNEKEGILQNADVIVQNGKIAKVGKALAAPSGAKTIDGTGKHLTSGIIDEHSHIALFTINEGGQSSSAEVRMSDVINPDDINIYRQLAGGVTASQLLHGSANSIGGQSAMIKLKWGATQSEMLLPDVKTIKFALGENVKQSNWGDVARVRFPQTRMGVEQIYFDHFIRAKEYASSWKTYNANPKKQSAAAPRRDIELDALAEILANERFITCHSYVQSEINMLMHVADSLKFRINTFTHILEGYKLADGMAKRGIGGSTFADWWAYKMEVKEAIPYNAALMYHEGVTVAINSDDGEMARRLNQEAAKTVEYGGVPEEDAWKMVTLNPAKLLHLDNRMGSVKAGKDADLVLWNAHPLSVYARPDFTMIDGTVYFDRKKDEEKQKSMLGERERLIQKMIGEKTDGKPTQKPQASQPKMFHCEDVMGISTEHQESR